jgi:hypothetical protein
MSSRHDPMRDGLTLIERGGKGSASMSGTPWIGASQVIRSRCGASAASASGTVRSGSSSHASGKPSAQRV